MRLTACCLIALGIALAACGRDDTAPAPATPPPAAVVEPAPDALPPSDPTPRVVDDERPVDAQVARVDLSDSAGGKPWGNAPFAKDAVVHLGIRTEGAAEAYTLSAKWIAPDGAVLTEYGQRVAGSGPQVTDFSLSRPDGWPPGRYKVELAINGRPAHVTEFVVE